MEKFKKAIGIAVGALLLSATVAFATTFSDDVTINGNDLFFGGGGTVTVDFQEGGSKIYEDTHLRLATNDDMYLNAPGTIYVQNDLKVENKIVFDAGTQALYWDGGNTRIYDDGNITIDTNDDFWVRAPGTSYFTGAVVIQGNTQLGNAATDTINFSGGVNSDVLPLTKGTYNLGSNSKEWNNAWFDGIVYVDQLGSALDEIGRVYIGDDTPIYFGSDQDVALYYDELTDDRLEFISDNTYMTGALTVGTDLTVSGNDLVFGNAETISNSTDGTISFTDGTNTLASIIDSGTTGYFSTGAVVIGTSYEPDLQFTGTVVEVEVVNTGTITFRDSASNTLMTVADGGTVGNVAATGTLTAGTGLTVTSGGATVTAGGLTVTAGGLTVTAGGATITAGGLDMTNDAITNIGAAGTDFSATGGLTLADILTVSSGGAAITGATAVTGALTATSYGGITEANLLDKSATETVSGDWTFSGTVTGGFADSSLTGITGVDFKLDADNTAGAAVSQTITFERGTTGTDATIQWDETNDRFNLTVGGLSIPTGATYMVNGTQVSSDNLSDVASIAMLDEAEAITGNWVNTTNPWADNEVANDLTISGGTIDNSVIGGTTAAAGSFTTVAASSTGTFTGVLRADGGLDRSSAAALAIGATNATSVTITPATTISGAATLSSTLGVTGNSTFTGAVYANGGLDRSTAAALAIGATNATAVNITPATTFSGAMTGSSTFTLQGQFTANATSNFNGAVNVGTDGTGHTVTFYSDTVGDYLQWSDSNVRLTIIGTDGSNALAVTDGNVAITDSLDVGATANLDAVDIDLGAAEEVNIDATTTAHTGTGGVLDIDVGAGDAAVDAVNVALTVNDGATATTDYRGLAMTLTANDADADVFGIVITAADAANAGANSYEAAISIDNADTTAGSMPDAIIITSSGVAAGVTDAIDASADNITNALNVGANTILGTTGVIDFTDFDVSADGLITLASDSAGDQISVTAPAGDHQILVVDASTNANTSTAGLLDLNIGAGDAAVDGINVGLTVNDGATATTDYEGMVVTLTANDADADLFGLVINAANTANAAAGSYEAAVKIDNADDAAGSMPDAILITSTTDTAITDALDASDAEIVNALNAGANTILGTTAVIDFTDFDVSADGLITVANDADGVALTVSPSIATTTAIDVSDANITNAISVGANTILGTTAVINFNLFDVAATGAVSVTNGADVVGLTIAPTIATTTAIDVSDTDIVSAISVGDNTITGTTAVIDFTDFDVSADGLVTLAPDGGGTGITITPSAALTTGLDVSNANITNGVSLGATTLLGTTAVIDFTDFDVSADGLITLASDSAGDQISVTAPAGDHQVLVVDATTNDNTSTAGVIDLNIDAGNAAVIGTDVALTQVDGAAAGTDAIAQNITLTGNDADGDMFGIKITAADTVNAGANTYEAAIAIDNADTTAGSMPDAIIITSSGVDTGVTDAIDASASNITNAINVGANTIAGGAAVINFDSFDVASTGATTILNTLTTGVDGTGHTVTFYSDAAGDSMVWSDSAAKLTITGGDAADALTVADGNVNFASADDVSFPASTIGAADIADVVRVIQLPLATWRVDADPHTDITGATTPNVSAEGNFDTIEWGTGETTQKITQTIAVPEDYASAMVFHSVVAHDADPAVAGIDETLGLDWYNAKTGEADNPTVVNEGADNFTEAQTLVEVTSAMDGATLDVNDVVRLVFGFDAINETVHLVGTWIQYTASM